MPAAPDDDVLVVTQRCRIPLSELTFRFSRSGGPGGQNVNVRDTKVEVVFDLAGSPSLSEAQRRRAMAKLESRLDSRGRLRVVASDERTQSANRALVVERLRETLAEALAVPKQRRPTKPSRGAKERRIAAKRQRSQRKRDRAWRPEE